jgi:cyclophilin family peptidyl-prolyl cis-trans isomerase
MRLLPLTVLIAVALTAGLVSLSCGGDDDENTVTVKSGGGVELKVTPYPTAALPEGPIPTRTDEFAALCQKTDQKQWDEMPPIIIDPDLDYTAVIRTEKGDVTIKLLPDVAPWTVNNFVFLACSGFYDGLTFHRVVLEPLPAGVPHPFVQAGDPSGRSLLDPKVGGPGYYIPEEISDHKFLAGTMAMSSRGLGTPIGGSQFFITLEESPEIDGQYTIFGEVTEGIDVLEKLTPRNPQAGDPPGDKMLEIIIQEE